MQAVKFKTLRDCDKEGHELIQRRNFEYASKVGERIMSSLLELDGVAPGFEITRLEHCLQTATRAWYDGADLDWIVSALLHNIGFVHAPFDNDEQAALVLRPFVREQCSWTVQNHWNFQKFYYGPEAGQHPNERERNRNAPYYDDCVYFCENWDQVSFDPAYRSLPVEFFRPLVMDVFSRSPYDITVTRPRRRVPLFDDSVAQMRKMAA